MKIKILTITTLILLVSIMFVGCGEEESPHPASVLETTPSDNGEMAANGTLTIKFDNPPKSGTVKVNGTPATGAGTTYTWVATGLTPDEAATLNIEWINDNGNPGSHTITVGVLSDCSHPPEITGSSPKDGEKDVDPVDLKNKGITIEFDDNMDTQKTKIDIVIDGEVINWEPRWSDDNTSVTLEYVEGEDIPYEAVVEIHIPKATDDAGNATDLKIIFSTKALEDG